MLNKYRGIFAAICAYFLWGILPVYWKLLQEVPAYEILCHRMSWSLIFTFGMIVLVKRQRVLMTAIKDWKTILTFAATGLFLAVNWLLYIWAVNAGYIIEASLGYFINPLLNVFLGMVFFQEKMRLVQWIALLIAAAGVVYLTLFYGRFPWIALVLASSFATYGLLHKKSPLPALDGLCIETGVLFLPAIVVLAGLYFSGGGAFGHISPVVSLLLAGTGIITSIPLLLFGYAAHKIPLSTLGLLQYIAPTINLLLGIFLYNEAFPIQRMIGFVLIWSALFLFLAENLLRSLNVKKQLLVKDQG
jgi:chloramphenicol-sensitive protein RarD